MRKWLIRVGVAIVVSAIAFAAILWIGSELVLRKSYAETPAVAPAVPGDVESG